MDRGFENPVTLVNFRWLLHARKFFEMRAHVDVPASAYDELAVSGFVRNAVM